MCDLLVFAMRSVFLKCMCLHYGESSAWLLALQCLQLITTINSLPSGMKSSGMWWSTPLTQSPVSMPGLFTKYVRATLFTSQSTLLNMLYVLSRLYWCKSGVTADGSGFCLTVRYRCTSYGMFINTPWCP